MRNEEGKVRGKDAIHLVSSSKVEKGTPFKADQAAPKSISKSSPRSEARLICAAIMVRVSDLTGQQWIRCLWLDGRLPDHGVRFALPRHRLSGDSSGLVL